MSSDEKVKANQQNSQNSTGPTTPEGKARTRLNALKSGLFCRDLVIASLGERQEDFDDLVSDLQELFPPLDVLIGFFVRDAAGILLRIQRVRRYETAEIRKRCDTARYRRTLERLSEVTSLKIRFALDSYELWTSAPRSVERRALMVSLDDTRKQLERTSLGLDFLLVQFEGIKKTVEREGYLSAQDLELMIRLWGAVEQNVEYIQVLNETAKTEKEEIKNEERTDPTRFEQTKDTFSALFEYKIEALRALKALITNLESAEEEACIAALVMPPSGVVETINRAETPLRRNLFKTIDALVTVVYGNSQ